VLSRKFLKRANNKQVVVFVALGAFTYGFAFAVFVSLYLNTVSQPSLVLVFPGVLALVIRFGRRDLIAGSIKFEAITPIEINLMKQITSIGQPGFYKYFNLNPTSSYTASIIGAVNSLFAAGAAAGAISQGWMGDGMGRKKAIVISCLFCIVGGALCAGSVNIAMLITCRFIQGIGLGQSICLVSVYLTEVANKDNRGLLSGLTACGLSSGYVM
jgi:hypothetical protein